MMTDAIERHGWILALAGSLGVWWVIGAVLQPSYLPTPGAVAQELVAGMADGGLRTAWLATLLHWLRGFAVAAGLGVFLGLLLGLLPVVGEAASPLVSFLRTLPGIAVLPLIVLLVGLNPMAISTVVVFSAVWFVLLNALEGVRTVPETLAETAAVYHVTGWRRVLRVIIPAAVPQIATGCKIALGLGLVVCVSAELVIGMHGLGAYVARSQASLQVPRAYAGVIAAAVTGLLALQAGTALERRFVHWGSDR